MMTKTILLAGLALLGCLAGCATHPGSGQPTARAGGQPALDAAVIDATGHAYVVMARTEAVRSSADSGQSWAPLRLPAKVASGHCIAVTSGQISAVTVDSAGMAYRRSTDGGATWSRIAVPLSEPTGAAQLALSPDGKRAAILATLPGTANSGGLGELFVQTSDGRLVARSAPVDGSLAWVGNRLLLSGGPLDSRLYTSDNGGASWTRRAIGGVLAPSFNLDPATASIGMSLPGPAGSVLLPVTTHAGTSSSVQLYSSATGVSFIPATRVPLAASAAPGSTAVVSPAGTGRYLVAEPGSTRMHLVTRSGQLAFTAMGLPGPVDSLSFSDAGHGLAQLTLRSCGKSKAECSESVQLFQTADGGRSWHRAAL